MRTRRVGSLTCGVVLVVFGVLFLLRWFIPALNYEFILRFWPLVLIALGVEMLVAAARNKEDKVKYDGGAIVLVFILSIFSLAMGAVEYAITTGAQYIW